MNKFRVNNRFTAGMLVLLSVLVTACMKFEGEDDEEKMVENETAMINYLAENNLTAIKDTMGLYYRITDPRPTAKAPAIGDEVQFFYKISLLDGTIIDTSSSVTPIKMPYGVNIDMPGRIRAIGLSRVGEKGIFLLPFYLAYGRQAIDKVPAYSPVRLDLHLTKARSEETQIVDYIDENELEVGYSDESGLRIVRLNEVEGDPIGVNRSVKVKYKVWALSDKTKTLDSGDLNFTTNTSTVISGFDKGIQKLRVGEKAILLFPSELGYGAGGQRNQTNTSWVILPYAPLAFEVEISQ